MNYKHHLLVFFLGVSHLCLGQTIDSVSWLGGAKLITDHTLNDNGNCFKVDTFMNLHACDNYHGEEYRLIFYPQNSDLCDSIMSVSSEEERKQLVNKLKREDRSLNYRAFRLIQDRILQPNYFYSPEVLYQINFGDKPYYFNSITANWEIESKLLENDIKIVERIPKLFNQYDRFKIKLRIISADGEVRYELKSAKLSKEELIKGCPIEEIDKIEIEIKNNCNDKLIMNLVVR